MSALPLLSSPDRYRPCIQDLLTDARAREYWLRLFERHVETLAALPVAGGALRDRPDWPAFADDYLSGLAALRERPDARGELTVLELTKYRDERLAAFGFGDPFVQTKSQENEGAFAELPALLADLDGCAADALLERLVRGLMAGNLFDMGSKAAVDAFAAKDHGFLEARRRVRPRPWRFDDVDAWRDRLRNGPAYRKAMVFVDNAGPDIVLGMIPFARRLASGGTRVILAANSAPALNDVTASELGPLLERAASIDPVLNRLLADRRIRVVASGCKSPLIDLRELTRQCRAEAADCDLVVLEGMGRAIESNFDAAFTVDAIKVALVKDPMVADLIGVELFEPVFRFEPGAGS